MQRNKFVDAADEDEYDDDDEEVEDAHDNGKLRDESNLGRLMERGTILFLPRNRWLAREGQIQIEICTYSEVNCQLVDRWNQKLNLLKKCLKPASFEVNLLTYE